MYLKNVLGGVFLAFSFFFSLSEESSAGRYEPAQSHEETAYATNHESVQSSSNISKKASLWEQTVGSIELPRHSWEAPLTYDNYLGDWDLAMATIPAHHYVVLTPAVANRAGMFWHRSPLKTKNFEIQFGFGVFGEDKDYEAFAKGGPVSARPEGFAFWYVYEEYAKIFPKNPEDQSQWDLFGYKNTPKGLGVFFKNFDRQGQLRPTISATYSNDGMRKIDVHADIPTVDGSLFGFRNQNTPVVFRLSVGPGGVVGEVRTDPSSRWIKCFHLRVQLEAGGFIGFTAFNGPDEFAAVNTGDKRMMKASVADLVALYFLKLWNLDLSVVGEDNAEVAKELGDIAAEDILKSHSSHKDERELSDSLKQLTRMLYKHISEQTPREQSMQRTLTSLASQINRLALDIKELKTEMRQFSNKGHGSENMQSVKSELSGLKNLLQKHSQHHTNSLSTLQQKLEAKALAASPHQDSSHIRELVNRTQQLETAISNHTSSSILTFGVVAVLIILLTLAIFVWKRFRELEKKHYL